MIGSSFLEHGRGGKLTVFLGIKHIFPAEYYFITLKQLLRIILHILKAHFLLHMFLHLGIIQKVLLQSLNSQILLVPRHHSPCLINFEIEKIHPLYPFELVLHQHLVDQSLALGGDRVDLLWNSEVGVFDDIDEIADGTGFKGAVTEQHLEEDHA